LKVEKFEGGNVRKVGLLGRLTPKCHSLEPGDVSVTCSIPPVPLLSQERDSHSVFVDWNFDRGNRSLISKARPERVATVVFVPGF
jgi:hypothetical protein